MKKLYYEIVNDVYYKIKEGPSPDLLRLGLILVMTCPMMIFFIFIMAVIQRHTDVFYELFFLKEFISNDGIYLYINAFILKILPFFIINYFLILHKNTYEKFLDFDKYQKGKLIAWYYFVFIFPVFLHLLYMLIFLS